MISPGRRILVLEPKWTGHYPMFAALVADALRGAGASTTLCLTRSGRDETGGIPELAEAEVGGRVEVRRTLAEIPRGYSMPNEADGTLEWSVIEEGIDAADADVILLPSGDALACAREAPMKIRRHGIPVAACIHNARFGYHGRGTRFMLRREWMRWRMRRCGMALGTLDPIAFEAGKSIPMQLLPLPIRNQTLPDHSSSLIEEIARRIGGRRVVLAIGEHSIRKGTDRIVASWPAPAPTDAALVIAGSRSPIVDKAIEARRSDVEAGRIIDIDQVLSSEEFEWLVERADVGTTVYRNHVGISGIVHDAAAAGTAVLGSEEGGIGRLIADHHLGVTIPSDDDQALARALAGIAIETPRVDEHKRQAFVDTCRGASLGKAWLEFVSRSTLP